MIAIVGQLAAHLGLPVAQLISTGGAAFGFLGGLLLAFAASRELSAHRLAISGLQLETTALIAAAQNPHSDLVHVGGTDSRTNLQNLTHTTQVRASLVPLPLWERVVLCSKTG